MFYASTIPHAPRPAPPIPWQTLGWCCRSRGVQDDPGQPIWTQAVIPAEPDAWIWAGDFAYLDHPVRWPPRTALSSKIITWEQNSSFLFRPVTPTIHSLPEGSNCTEGCQAFVPPPLDHATRACAHCCSSSWPCR